MKALLGLILCCIATAAFAQSDDKPVYAPLKTVNGEEGVKRMENITIYRPLIVYIPLDVQQMNAARGSTCIVSNYLPEETAKNPHKVATRSLNSAANSVPLVVSRDGETPSIRGARPEGTAYYFDGVRMLSGAVRNLR